ncbi:uncharacterized protein RCC_11275 [Ramularia collo-cygni]|uniref:C2H2-type domain-containing protein n=1 Tax=Ramularia collo-cygni TaxID=112498 RepID=A0A2D3VJA5_9PEZI|nr:uncharacterized protein RCC_11275 [Ramularia collo-cygni]CZT25542.1 uncharacterized protein RCC_11275 [Ramularia collo-cygni]
MAHNLKGMHWNSNALPTSTASRQEPYRYLLQASDPNMAMAPPRASKPAVVRCRDSSLNMETHVLSGSSTECRQIVETASGSSLSSPHTLRFPVDDHTSSNSNRPRCFEHGCAGREFSNVYNYRRHIQERSRSKSTECPWCSAQFTRKSNRDAHIATGRCRRLNEELCETYHTLLTDPEFNRPSGAQQSVGESDSNILQGEARSSCLIEPKLFVTDDQTGILQEHLGGLTSAPLDWGWEQPFGQLG